MVEPVHIFEGGVLDLVEVTPRCPLVDKFCLVEADDRLGPGVVGLYAAKGGLRPRIRLVGAVYQVTPQWSRSLNR